MKRGRPMKSEASKLSERVTFALTKEETDQLIRRARKDRMDVGPWIRNQLKHLGILVSRKYKTQQPV